VPRAIRSSLSMLLQFCLYSSRYAILFCFYVQEREQPSSASAHRSEHAMFISRERVLIAKNHFKFR
jgi:hypothetical protein